MTINGSRSSDRPALTLKGMRMKTDFYITIDNDGKNARITRNASRTESYHICFPVRLNIPDVYFERPQLSATIAFEERDQPPSIAAADVLDIERVLKDTTGFQLNIAVEHPSEEQ